MKRSQVIAILALLITISSVNQWTDLPIDNTFAWWGIYLLILFYFVKARKYFYNKVNNKNLYILFAYLIWNGFCVLRGLLVAENYWEWKQLVSTAMFLALPLSIYVTTNKWMVQKIIFIWLKYALPGFFILYYFLHKEAIGRYLIPISFLFLFFPIIKRKWKFILVFFTLLVFLTDLSARSNVIKFAVPVIFSCIYYIRALVGKKLINTGRLILLILPWLLFLLSINGVFNPFAMDDYIEGDFTSTSVSSISGEQRVESLTADTRTPLYVEVLESAINNNYVILGRTPARGNDSELFGSSLNDELKTGKLERFSNEVAVLNIFTWTGLIGVILYFLIFFKASYLAVNQSNNIFIKIIGLYISFRWLYAWVEDFSRFNLANLFLWIAIGLCFSASFRNMTDKEVKKWVSGIFDKRYRKLEIINYKKRMEWLLNK